MTEQEQLNDGLVLTGLDGSNPLALQLLHHALAAPRGQV